MGILNLPSVPPNQLGHFVFGVQDLQKTTVFFHYIKKNVKLSPHKHFVTKFIAEKAYTGSWLAMPNLRK